MARAIWTGNVSFGLVNVPVKMYSAISQKTVRFNQINPATGSRISQKRVDAGTGQEVAYDAIVKGYQLGENSYVVIDPSELEALAPKKNKMIELEEFVNASEIDPMAYDTSYYLGPDPGASRAYKLLVRTLAQANKVAIGRVVLRTRESLVAVRAKNDVLVLSTLHWADELNDSDSIVDIERTAEPTEKEVQVGSALAEALTGEFDHASYEDEYRAQVLDLIERKAAGEENIAGEPIVEPTEPTPDLIAALEASLEATPKKKQKTAKAEKAKVKR